MTGHSFSHTGSRSSPAVGLCCMRQSLKTVQSNIRLRPSIARMTQISFFSQRRINQSNCTVTPIPRRKNMKCGKKPIPVKFMMIWFSPMILLHIKLASSRFSKRICAILRRMIKLSTDLKKSCVITMSAIRKTPLTV